MPFSVPIPLVGAVVTIATAAVVLGGIKSISSVAEFVVPLMAAFYVAASAYVLFNQSAALPGAFVLVVKSAFEPTPVAGGATGAVIVSVMTAMRTRHCPRCVHQRSRAWQRPHCGGRSQV